MGVDEFPIPLTILLNKAVLKYNVDFCRKLIVVEGARLLRDIGISEEAPGTARSIRRVPSTEININV
jgi:hypothetical protein